MFQGFHVVGRAHLSILSGIVIFYFDILADQVSKIRR